MPYLVKRCPIMDDITIKANNMLDLSVMTVQFKIYSQVFLQDTRSFIC